MEAKELVGLAFSGFGCGVLVMGGAFGIAEGDTLAGFIIMFLGLLAFGAICYAVSQ